VGLASTLVVFGSLLELDVRLGLGLDAAKAPPFFWLADRDRIDLRVGDVVELPSIE